VLRGPQGTLYGSGSMGGTIKVITGAPELQKFDASADAGLSGTKGGGTNYEENAMLNLPLVGDVAAFRLVVSYKYTSGWIDRIVKDDFPYPTNNGCTPTSFQGCNAGNVAGAPTISDYSDVNWTRVEGGRADLLIKPSEALTIELGGFWQELQQGGPSQYDAEYGLAPIGGVLAHFSPADVPEPFGDTFSLFSATINYDLAFANLTSATGYWRRTEFQNPDITQGQQNLFFLPTFIASPNNETDKTNQFSEELRLTSEGDSKFQWITGAFFEQLNSHYNYTAVIPALCYLSVGGCAANPEGIEALFHNPYTIKQYALFANASYKFTPELKLTTGARYFDFQNRQDYDQAGFFTASGNATPSTGFVESRNSGVSPMVNLSYQPSQALNLYATIAKGFRPGGVNIPVPTAGAASCTPALEAIGLSGPVTQYGPDSIWSYEVGEKARINEGRFTINSDFYYNVWRHIQLVTELSCGFPYNNNAGNAATYGPEIEVAAELGAGFAISASGTYTHATLTNASADSGYANGDSILNIPDFTASSQLSYTRPLTDTLNFKGIFMESYVGSQTDVNYYRETLPSYNLMNLRLMLERQQWKATVFVNNLADKRAALTINNNQVTFAYPDLTRVTTNQPRTVGVQIAFKY
jgi:iron complex outermembrane recepter protein